jgi:hypothetical protein
MVNRYLPHVLVLPEDDANRQIANGFVLSLDSSVFNKIQVLEEVGGWGQVLDRFESDHVGGMDRYTGRHLVLLIDFDGDRERLRTVKDRIPEHLIDRVFVLGALSEPEALKGAGLGHYETIGREMANDCRQGTDVIWNHALLRHNASEIERLRQHVRPILFD